MRKFNHLLFWIVVVTVLTIVFGYDTNHFSESFYFVSMLLPIIVGTSYFFNYFLVPKYLLSKRYFKFGLYTLYTIIISVYFEMLVIVGALVLLANYQYANMNPATTNVFVLAIVMYFIVFLNGFILLIKKAFISEHQINTLETEKRKQEKGYLLVKADRKTSKIRYDEIAYIESLADYVKIVKSDHQTVITKEKISVIADKLPEAFYRIHRSFIINSQGVTSFSKESIVINGKSLPISRSYKKEVGERLREKKT